MNQDIIWECFLCTKCLHELYSWIKKHVFRSLSHLDSLTGLTIHFCLGPPSSHARFSSFRSDGRTKVCGKNPNSFFPFWTWSLERFLHSRSFLPIWNDPGKWLSWNEKACASLTYCKAQKHSDVYWSTWIASF